MWSFAVTTVLHNFVLVKQSFVQSAADGQRYRPPEAGCITTGLWLGLFPLCFLPKDHLGFKHPVVNFTARGLCPSSGAAAPAGHARPCGHVGSGGSWGSGQPRWSELAPTAPFERTVKNLPLTRDTVFPAWGICPGCTQVTHFGKF